MLGEKYDKNVAHECKQIIITIWLTDISDTIDVCIDIDCIELNIII